MRGFDRGVMWQDVWSLETLKECNSRDDRRCSW